MRVGDTHIVADPHAIGQLLMRATSKGPGFAGRALTKAVIAAWDRRTELTSKSTPYKVALVDLPQWGVVALCQERKAKYESYVIRTVLTKAMAMRGVRVGQRWFNFGG